MKKYIFVRTLVSLFLFGVLSVAAQTLYVPGGTVGSSLNGNVGIGTAGPGALLTIDGGAATDSQARFTIQTGDSATGVGSGGGLIMGSVYNGAGVQAYKVNASSTDMGYELQLLSRPSNGNMTVGMVLGPTGNVGIGLTDPSQKLEVNGDVEVDAGFSYLFGDYSGTYVRASWGLGLHGDTTHPVYCPDASLVVGYQPVGASYGVGDLLVSGNVGIGTTDPTYPLAVNGTIRAKEVIVDTGWSDYVFGPSYHLEPLAEVASYIEVHHHLQGIPTATQVKVGGVSLGQMQAKLLAQVEQLTLHLIALNKRLQDQQREIVALKSDLTRSSTPHSQ